MNQGDPLGFTPPSSISSSSSNYRKPSLPFKHSQHPPQHPSDGPSQHSQHSLQHSPQHQSQYPYAQSPEQNIRPQHFHPEMSPPPVYSPQIEADLDSYNDSSEPLQIPFRTLNCGIVCPGIGYGTGGEGRATPEELYDALRAAIDSGFRSFDSAPFYQDGLVEKTLGRAIRDSGVPRPEFFVTTKVWPTYARFPQESLKMSLENMQLDYVDCLLMHWPIPLRPVPNEPYAMGESWDAGWSFNKAWVKMQELPKTQVRSLGVCNFTINRLRLLLSSPSTKTVPAVLQVEGHPELPQNPLMRFCREHKIQVFCFSPLAQGQVSNPIIREVAQKHNTGAGQVALSWAILRGTVPLPKSVNPERIRQNMQLVYLDEQDFEVLNTLGKYPRRIINPRILFGHDIFENNADSYEDDQVVNKVENEDDETVEHFIPRKRKG